MSADCLAHQAFIYSSPEDFVASMAPFVREGLEHGDKVFAAARLPNVEALREELGGDAASVDLHDATEWCTRPYDRLQAFKQLVAETPDGRILRAMGEPVWDGSDAVVRQWARYESIINLALADAPMRFICLYDGASLPDDILDYAVRTHPEQVDQGATVACDGYVAPDEFLPGLPPDPPPSAHELPSAGTTFRRIVAERALAAGVTRERAAEFVVAANEIATNALLHAGGPVSAHVWEKDDELVCRIADAGPGLTDPLAGWLPPPRPSIGGWGLPLARQLCDAVEIVPRADGTVISLALVLDEAR